MKLLLETRKVFADSKDQFSRTALSLASESGHISVVDIILKTGNVDADSKATGAYGAGRTPLSFAAGMGHDEIVQRLLDTGRVDPDSKATGPFCPGQTPLSWTAGGGHKTVVELLLKTGRVDINSESTGRYSRHIAPIAWVGHPRSSFSEFKTTEQIAKGRTALWWAAANRVNVDLMKLLLENGADVDMSPEHGQTPLSLVAEEGDEAAVRLFLNYGAKAEKMDDSGQMPVDYARTGGHEAVIKLLEQISSQCVGR